MDHRKTLEGLVTGRLDPAGFRHRDHVGVAYEALSCTGYFEALHLVGGGIRGLARKGGDTSKFNATITQAFLSLIAERMSTTPHRDAEDFLERNPDLLQRDLLSPWYSRQRLGSPLARRIALLPDLAGPGGH